PARCPRSGRGLAHFSAEHVRRGRRSGRLGPQGAGKKGGGTMGAPQELKGPDLAAGIDGSELRDGEPLLGHAAGEPIVLVRSAGEVCAVGAVCTHYGGPLSEGIVEGNTIRCPWHHARYDLRTGAAARPGRDFYSERKIDLLEQAEVTAVDAGRREVRLSTGESLRFGALLLATGAEPIRLGIPGADRALTLRSFADSKAIAARASSGRRAVVIGASFIGLEVAASLRARNLEVSV